MNQNICILIQIILVVYLLTKCISLNIIENLSKKSHTGYEVLELLKTLIKSTSDIVDNINESDNDFKSIELRHIQSSLVNVIISIYLTNKNKIEEYLQLINNDLSIDDIISEQDKKYKYFIKIKNDIENELNENLQIDYSQMSQIEQSTYEFKLQEHTNNIINTISPKSFSEELIYDQKSSEISKQLLNYYLEHVNGENYIIDENDENQNLNENSFKYIAHILR